MVTALKWRESPWNSLAPSQRRLPGLGVGSCLILPGKVAESSLIEGCETGLLAGLWGLRGRSGEQSCYSRQGFIAPSCPLVLSARLMD